MRILAALTICMSIGSGAMLRADDSWKTIHDQGLAAMSRNDFQAASQLFEKSWERAGTPVERAISANDLGVSLHQSGREKEAATWLDRALTIWKADPSTNLYATRTAEALGTVLRILGDIPAAEKLLRETLAAGIENGEDKARVLNLLGEVLHEEGWNGESREAFAEARGIPGASWERLVDSNAGLADLDRNARSWDDSVAEWNSAADLARAHQAPLLEAGAVRGLGETWLEKGDLARAEPLLRRALAIFQADPLSGLQLGSTLSCMAKLYLAENKPLLAEDALNHAAGQIQRELGDDHPDVAVILEMMGNAEAQLSKMDLARGYFERALSIMVEKFGEGSAMVGVVFANWGTAEQRGGDAARAALQYQKALEILRTSGRDLMTLRLFVTEHYAQVLKATHHGKEASALLAEVKSLR